MSHLARHGHGRLNFRSFINRILSLHLQVLRAVFFSESYTYSESLTERCHVLSAVAFLISTIQYNIKKTYKAPYVTKKLFVGAGVTRDTLR